jgi:hypothetical protein
MLPGPPGDQGGCCHLADNHHRRRFGPLTQRQLSDLLRVTPRNVTGLVGTPEEYAAFPIRVHHRHHTQQVQPTYRQPDANPQVRISNSPRVTDHWPLG